MSGLPLDRLGVVRNAESRDMHAQSTGTTRFCLVVMIYLLIILSLQAGLNAEAIKLREFGPKQSVVRHLGANEVHRHLLRERKHRILFLTDRKQRLVLMHDKAKTAVAALRRSIDNQRRTNLQTQQAFERKQTQLEVIRHKLVLSLEAANAADEERKVATAKRVAAIEAEDANKAVSANGSNLLPWQPTASCLCR